MFSKLKEFWQMLREKAEEIRNKLPKHNPNVTVEWKDGQPEFKDKNDKK